MTWAAGVRREIISDRARSSSSTPDGASGGATCHTCAGAALDHACRRFVLPWAGHVCWSAPVCGDRRPLAVKARPGTPSVRCGTGPVWTASPPTAPAPHRAPLRASTPPQRPTPGAGLYRAQRAALFTLIIHKKATIIKPSRRERVCTHRQATAHKPPTPAAPAAPSGSQTRARRREGKPPIGPKWV